MWKTGAAALAALTLLAGGIQGARADEPVRYVDPVFDDVTVTRNLVYGASVDNFGELRDLTLDVYEPAGDVHTARPVMIWIHGGGFKSGSKNDGNMSALARGYAERGWVAASINYRLRPNGTPGSSSNRDLIVATATGYPDQIHDAQWDAQAAVRWFRAHAAEWRIDPDLVMAGGGSAGAVTALEVLVNPEDPGNSGNPGYDSSIRAAVSLWGATDARRIEPGTGPMLMYHGTNDTTVPYALGVESCAGHLANLNHCDLVTYPGEGHGPWSHRDEILVESAAWLYDHVLSVPGA